MRIVLNSLVFGEEELIKVFNKNLEAMEIVEEEFCVNTGGLKGSFRSIQLNKLLLITSNLESKETMILKASRNFPLFKLQFQQEGNLSCFFENNKKSFAEIIEGTYNLLYLPESNMTYVFDKKTKNTIEIYFTEAYVQTIMGYCFTGKSMPLRKAKLNRVPFAFFNKGMQINEQIYTLLSDIISCSFTGVMKKAFLEAKITELVLIALNNQTANVTEDEIAEVDQVNLKRAENYIKEHLKEELNITDLSVMAAMNTSKFKKCFKQLYGTTVFKYITSLRISKAKQLIQQEGYTISQASYEVGYKNPQHFTVAFKKKLGYLPSQLKK